MILPQVAKLLGFLLQVYELLSECFVRCRVLLQGAAAGVLLQGAAVRVLCAVWRVLLQGAGAGFRCRVPLQGALVTMTPL